MSATRRFQTLAIGLAVSSALYWWLLVPAWQHMVLDSSLNDGGGDVSGYFLLFLLAVLPVLLHGIAIYFATYWAWSPTSHRQERN